MNISKKFKKALEKTRVNIATMIRTELIKNMSVDTGTMKSATKINYKEVDNWLNAEIWNPQSYVKTQDIEPHYHLPLGTVPSSMRMYFKSLTGKVIDYKPAYWILREGGQYGKIKIKPTLKLFSYDFSKRTKEQTEGKAREMAEDTVNRFIKEVNK